MIKPSDLDELPDFPDEEEYAIQALQEFASFLEAGEGSRDGGRANKEWALGVAMRVVEPWVTKHDCHAARIVEQELAELAAALRMATRGEKHPALQASKKSPSQRRGFSTDAKQLIESCLLASDCLVRVGKSRTDADLEVVARANSAAPLVGIKLSATQLKHHRKRFRWLDRMRRCWRRNLDQETLGIMKEGFLGAIDLMADRMRRRVPSDR